MVREKADQNIIILPEVDSTNNYANRLINKGNCVHGTIVMALWQQRGKGQRGNLWESSPNMNMLSSIILFPGYLKAEDQFYLSKITSLAIVDFLKGEITDVAIKWPNDIYAGGQKIGGILIENMIQENYLYSSVVGIGLNINQIVFSQALDNVVSLRLLTGKHYSLVEVLKIIKEKFFIWYGKLETGNIKEIDTGYLADLYRRNIYTRFRIGNKVIEAKISGIGKFGQLIIEERSGALSEHTFGKIEFVT